MPRGHENLRPNITTTERAKELGRLGGIQKAKKIRERKLLKEELLAILSSEDYQNKISTALIQKAAKGDVKAFEVIRDTIGEKPVEKVLNIEPPIIVDDIDE